MVFALRPGLVASLAASIAMLPAVAWPCGAMVFPQHEERPGGMSDQELLVAFAADQTVLVASAGYEGIDPAAFAFLLPIAAEPTEVRDADPALFIALDEESAPRVSIFLEEDEPPSLGCGAKSGDFSNGGRGDGGEVMVQQRGTTDSYEWVVLGGDTGTAVATWLSDEGYVLPADYAAALDPYVSDGWFFFAAKVLPGTTAGTLAPIELHLPPSAPEAFRVPFGIAAHSLAPGQPLGITTYLWSDGAVLPDDQASASIAHEEVVALSDSESNYDELQQAILDIEGGAWIIDFARLSSADEIRSAYAQGEEEGRVDPSKSDVGFVDDFFTRIGMRQGFLTRLRTELPAESLHDLSLRRDASTAVDNEYLVTFSEEEEGGSCSLGRRRGLPAGLVLALPVLVWLRPRRRHHA